MNTPTREDCVAAAIRLGPAEARVSDILELAAARPFALDALLSVAAVEWSAEISTACVECADRPRLLLNPAFVERWCFTRERLAMLILHELSHISLGHTRLYTRPTAAHNVAFDAIINAVLLLDLERRTGGAAPYAALPAGFYDAGESPWFLLRPPPGWPERADWQASAGCPDTLREIHRRLYDPDPRRGGLDDMTYQEIVSALRESGVGDGRRADLNDDAAADILRRLLGAHGTTDRESASQSSGRDAEAAGALATVLTAIGIDRKAHNPGSGGSLCHIALEGRQRERILEMALGRLLRQVFVECEGVPHRTEERVPILSVDPTRDRRAIVRRAAARTLGAPAPMLFHSDSVRFRTGRQSAVVYIDVSGSMAGLVGRLHAALAPLSRLLAASVFLFSETVVAVTRADFVLGRGWSTGGTSITPVIRHLAGLPANGRAPVARKGAGRPGAVPYAPRPRARSAHRPRALVLTDGYFDSPPAAVVRALAAAGGIVHLGIIGGGPMHQHQSWVASSTRLPDPLKLLAPETRP